MTQIAGWLMIIFAIFVCPYLIETWSMVDGMMWGALLITGAILARG